MNIRLIPTAIQVSNNPYNKETGFLWFFSPELDVGIVIDKEIASYIKESLDEIESILNTKAEYFGKIRSISKKGDSK